MDRGPAYPHAELRVQLKYREDAGVHAVWRAAGEVSWREVVFARQVMFPLARVPKLRAPSPCICRPHPPNGAKRCHLRPIVFDAAH
jgi:hypothetical protein